MKNSLNNLHSFESLQKATKTGWWRTNIAERIITFSSYPADVLGIAESITFDKFKRLISSNTYEQDITNLRNLLLYPDNNEVKLVLKTTEGYQKVFIKQEMLGVNEKGETITDGYITFQGHQKIKDKKDTIQDFLHKLYQNMPLGYFRLRIEIDENQKVVDYEYLDTNTKFLEIMHMKREQLIGKMHTDIGPIFVNKLDLQILADIAYRGKIHKERAQFRSDGRFYDSTIYSPQRGDVVALFVDITDEVLTTDALRESRQRLNYIYENAPIGIELYDKNGYTIDANEKAAALQKFSDKNALIGLNLFEHPFFPAHAAESLKQGKNVTFDVKSENQENQKDLSNTPFRYYTIKCTVLYNTNKEIENYLIIIIDNTEIYEINEALKKAKLKAEESDRLKSAFLANITHEIRTPLNAIIGFSDLLMDSNDQNEKESFMDIIKQNNEHLLQLINGILEFSRIEAGTINIEMTPINLSELCKKVINTFDSKITNRIDLCYIGGEKENLIIVSDYKQVAQVLSNILDNALKFTKEGHIWVGYRLLEKEVEIYVEDTGTGIPIEKKESIFEKFAKVDDFIPGSGLGLSMSKEIIIKLDGQIGVDSTVGKGSRFWFTLPLQPESDENRL